MYRHGAKKSRTSLTVACDISVLIFDDSEERGPLDKVLEVEVNIIVFRQGVEIGEIGVKQVSGFKRTERGHN